MGVKVSTQRHPTMPTLLKVRAMTKLENDSRIVNKEIFKINASDPELCIKGSYFAENIYPVNDSYETSIFPGNHTEGEIS
ncbi:hypothetical protein [Commensalibacter melissae]|uniref:hypothetical protein n=1 Tax=Commensalibacter melissae TaxID=2070537 RepID=UPI0012D92141|nr:hypothetical protein [Commensalibacter melissae]MUG81456.1 hypothetical protein [Commensalibacter melissae]